MSRPAAWVGPGGRAAASPLSLRAEAVLLIEQGRYEAAAAALCRASANGTDLAFVANLGRACLSAGAAEGAARVFRTCVERRPEAAFLGGLGAALAILGRAEEAERCFRDAVARDELCFDAWSGLARLGRLPAGDPIRARLEALAGRADLAPAARQRLLAVLATTGPGC